MPFSSSVLTLLFAHIVGSSNKNKYIFPPLHFPTVSSCLSSPHLMAVFSSLRVRPPSFCRWWPQATANARVSAWLTVVNSVPSFHHLFPLLCADMVENTDQTWVHPRAISHSPSESQKLFLRKYGGCWGGNCRVFLTRGDANLEQFAVQG